MSHLTPEKRVQNEIITYLKSIDYKHGGPLLWTRRNADEINYIEGSADLWVVIKGVHIEVEIKAPGKLDTRTAPQLRWERVCKSIGAPYLVTDSLTTFKNFIQQYL